MKKFLMDESGQGMVEYGLILGLIAVAAIGALIVIGPKVSGIFNSAKGELNKVDIPASE